MRRPSIDKSATSYGISLRRCVSVTCKATPRRRHAFGHGHLAAVAAALAFLGACATEPPARRAVEVAGVRITADRNAWAGKPAALEGRLDPVFLTIENESGRPLTVRFNELALVEPDGDRRPAVPPFQLTGAVPAVAGDVRGRSFTVAPSLGPHFPGWRPAASSISDQAYYRSTQSALDWIELPTPEMVRRALPEGVLADGGFIDGFAYFAEPDLETTRVELRFDLNGCAHGRAVRTRQPSTAVLNAAAHTDTPNSSSNHVRLHELSRGSARR